jgi:hypothetical protein
VFRIVKRISSLKTNESEKCLGLFIDKRIRKVFGIVY